VGYFNRLPDRDRDDVFRGHLALLRERGVVEDERRFIKNVAQVTTSAFASEVLSHLLSHNADHIFWHEVIIALIGQLSSADACAIVKPIVTITQTYDRDDFARRLVECLAPRDKRGFVASVLPILTSKRRDAFRSYYCTKNPELLDSKVIDDALNAAETSVHGISWIADAPAANMSQRDRAWKILLQRAMRSNFSSGANFLIEALRLRYAPRSGRDAEMLKGLGSATVVLEDQALS
jgi:hypothetical protein